MNLLRVDPTRTTTLTKRFIADLRRRFRNLSDAVIDFFVELDALGLKERTRLIFHVQPREFEFRTDPGKLEAFKEWLEQQILIFVLSADLWTFIRAAYIRGVINAHFAAKRGDVTDLSQEELLTTILRDPEILNKLQLINARALESLKGVAAQVSAEASRILADGLISGATPDQIAADIVARISSLAETKALSIARAEVVASHAEGQLDAFQRLGIAQLTVRAEWVTAGDDRVCKQCQSFEGQTFTIEEARGMIPLHPNCRCSWILA